MTYDPERSSFSSACRCSGSYIITEEEMEEGVDTVCCSSCTLSIRVLYQEASQKEEEEEEEEAWGAIDEEQRIRNERAI